MNVKNWIPLVAAVLLGLIALVVARKALTKSSGADGESPIIGVVVANRELPPGAELKPEDLAVAKLPADSLPGQSFRTVQELTGRTTMNPLVKGQAIVEPLLAPSGTRGGLPALIPDGYRAMTVEVNEFSGLAGMIQPGGKVDVIAVLRDDKSGLPAARTILQNLEVRAVGRNINPAPPADGQPQPAPSNNVTVLVTPKQAQTLQLATQNGRPWLVLRGGKDSKQIEAELTTIAELRNDKPDSKRDMVEVTDPTTRPSGVSVFPVSDPFEPRPSVPSARVVQVIRGGVESTVTFPQGTREVAAPAGKPTTRPMHLSNDGRYVTNADTGVE